MHLIISFQMNLFKHVFIQIMFQEPDQINLHKFVQPLNPPIHLNLDIK
jgi:hypothetical protein